jgi:hypothetical protein
VIHIPRPWCGLHPMIGQKGLGESGGVIPYPG